MTTITRELINTIEIKRIKTLHKGYFGKVLIVGGSKKYTGAVMLSCKASINTGTGLTYVATDINNKSAINAYCPEAIVISYNNKKEFIDLIKSVNVIVCGVGLGTSNKSLKVLKTVLTNSTANQTIIIDADAINLYHKLEITPQTKNLIFTPHQKEWERLSYIKISDQYTDKNIEYVKILKGNVILKKHQTEIYFTDGEIYTNQTGTSAMAMGGMGDVLSGILGSLIAQLKDYKKAILMAVYLHGYISDELAIENYVTTPSMIIDNISKYMKEFDQ